MSQKQKTNGQVKQEVISAPDTKYIVVVRYTEGTKQVVDTKPGLLLTDVLNLVGAVMHPDPDAKVVAIQILPQPDAVTSLVPTPSNPAPAAKK